MKKIFLWSGYRSKALQTDKFVMVDDEDYGWLIEFHSKWRLHRHGYAVCGSGGKTVLMHRLILGLDDSRVHVDHYDHNKLNNQRSNLIPGTQADNNRNAPFVGVGWHKAANKWRAWSRYECKHLGLFDRREDALAAVADSERVRLGA